MQLLIDPQGQIRCLYEEAVDLAVFGKPTIRRASQVEPDPEGRWWADLAPVGGPKLGPFDRCTEALAAEVACLETCWLAATPRVRNLCASFAACGIDFETTEIHAEWRHACLRVAGHLFQVSLCDYYFTG